MSELKADQWQRHDLLLIEPSGVSVSTNPEVQAWIDRSWPVIVRRFLPQDAPQLIPVAICLPRSPKNVGIAFQIPADRVRARLPAVRLEPASVCAPDTWHDTLRALNSDAELIGCPAAVFGSLMWQSVTGSSYIKEGSDLDVTWRVNSRQHAVDLARAITLRAALSPVLIDGEFILPDGSAVHWREFHDGADEVLTKTLREVRSRPSQSLFVYA